MIMQASLIGRLPGYRTLTTKQTFKANVSLFVATLQSSRTSK